MFCRVHYYTWAYNKYWAQRNVCPLLFMVLTRKTRKSDPWMLTNRHTPTPFCYTLNTINWNAPWKISVIYLQILHAQSVKQDCARKKNNNNKIKWKYIVHCDESNSLDSWICWIDRQYLVKSTPTPLWLGSTVMV